MVHRRKQEVLGARDAAVTPLSQTGGGRCHVGLGILHPAEILTKHRSTRCPLTNGMPYHTPKPDDAVIVKRRSASHGIAAKRNRLPRPSSRPSMTWGCLKTS
jgi:hypothetical protein